jgi:DinB superfamily
MARVTLTDDLLAIADALDAIERDVDTLCAPLDDRQFNWQPEGGRGWSIGQCLDHLTIALRGYLPAIAGAANRARRAGLARRGPIRLGFFGRVMVRNMEPPPRLRFPTPSKMAPASRMMKVDACTRFRGVHTELREPSASVPMSISTVRRW